jgi:hypothetical protein
MFEILGAAPAAYPIVPLPTDIEPDVSALIVWLPTTAFVVEFANGTAPDDRPQFEA